MYNYVYTLGLPKPKFLFIEQLEEMYCARGYIFITFPKLNIAIAET